MCARIYKLFECKVVLRTALLLRMRCLKGGEEDVHGNRPRVGPFKYPQVPDRLSTIVTYHHTQGHFIKNQQSFALRICGPIEIFFNFEYTLKLLLQRMLLHFGLLTYSRCGGGAGGG